MSNCKKDRAEQNNTHDQGDQSTSSHADFDYYRYAAGKRLAYIAGIPASNRPIRSNNIIFELLHFFTLTGRAMGDQIGADKV